MLKDPSTFRKGLLLALAWFAWFASGAAYASANGPIKEFLSNMASDTKIYFAAWLLVSTAMLFYAIVLLIRGSVGQFGPKRLT